MQKKKFVAVILIIGSILILGFLALNPRVEQNTDLNNVDSNNQQPAREMAAALVDSLYVSNPNSDFTSKLKQTLSQAGFAVDVYQGKQVTVDLLKKLPADYDLLILRMHSGVHSKTLGLYLFTAEPYVQEKYVQEQLFFLVKKAYAFNDSNPVFAVNWAFIKRCMTGKFNGTLVIVMGCEGALDPFMAEEFFNQEATAYIAWNDMVLPSHSDEATLQLIQNLYIENLTLQQAVDRTNEQVVHPNDNSTLTLTLP